MTAIAAQVYGQGCLLAAQSEIKLATLDPMDERRPCLVAEDKSRSATIFGVAHGNRAGQVAGDLDAG
jgi:hypothetical protein